MKQYTKDLGRVALVPEGAWSNTKVYDKLSIVYNKCDKFAYVSRKEVPCGVDIDNKEYWQPLNVNGYADNNFINLTKADENNQITGYDNIVEAATSVSVYNRRVGAVLSFYNINSDRLDRQPEFELWQFNSTNVNDWNKESAWQNIYYNWNVFVGWYLGLDALKNHVSEPTVGQYAYIGTTLNDALLVQCRANKIWTVTDTKVRDYISVKVEGNITIGDNGNWFNDGKDTGIPATPSVDEELDSIVSQIKALKSTTENLHTEDVRIEEKVDSNKVKIEEQLNENVKTLDSKIDNINSKLQTQITSNDEDIEQLQTKSTQLEKFVKDIAASSGASLATAVSYNNTNSGMTSVTTQGAIDKLDSNNKEINNYLTYKNRIQIYVTHPGTIYIEETTDYTKGIFFRFPYVAVRAVTNRTIAFNDLATELNAELVKSPSGVENCINIPDETVLVFDSFDSVFKFVKRNAVAEKQIIVISSINGTVDVTAHSYIVGQWIKQKLDKKIDKSSISEDSTDILKLNPAYLVGNLIIQSTRPYNNYSSAVLSHKLCTLSILADLHGYKENLQRFIEFSNSYKSYINDYLSLGDTVTDSWDDNMDFWDEVEGSDEILMTIGNHDTAQKSNSTYNWTAHFGKENYNRYFKNISKWNVTQPDGAETNGYCFYYKDYSDAKLRLVILDSMTTIASPDSVDVTQKQWLQTVLTAAKNDGLSVVIGTHYPAKIVQDTAVNTFNSMDLKPFKGISDDYFDIVDTFINDGGDFVCWINGHSHYDMQGTVENHPNQLSITFENAGCNSYWNDSVRIKGTKSQDSFNVVTFDTQSKLIKILRVGNNSDRYLRTKNFICWDYKNKNVIICR